MKDDGASDANPTVDHNHDDWAGKDLAALTVSRDRYRYLYDLSPIGHLTLDRTGKIRELNVAAADLLGAPRAQTLGQPLAAFLDQAAADVLYVHLHKVLATGGREECDLLVRPRGVDSDSWVPVHVQSVSSLDADGQRSECRMVVIDLSELHQTRAELRAAEARGRGFLDSSFDAVVSGSAGGRIETFNLAAERLFGHPVETIIGQDVGILMPAPHREGIGRWLDRLPSAVERQTVGPIRQEVIGLRRDGSEFPAELAIGGWWEHGERKLVLVFHDLTEQRRQEQEKAQLVAQVRLAQRMEAIAILASGVAHDFNNLLMGISSCADIALHALGPESPAGMFLEELKASAASGAAISRQLLTFGNQHDLPSVFELNDLIGRARPIIQRLLGREVGLAIRLGADDSRVRIPPGQIEQILMNLAVNARDAMPTGGTLAIETRPITFANQNRFLLPPGEYVRLTVTDSGQGMPDEIRRRIFEPFFTTKEAGKGTGLGLSTVHNIVQQASGHVAVESVPGHGTTFEILLPNVHERITREMKTPTPIQALPGEGTVLLVEDDRMVRMGVHFYLEQGGYRVIEAGNAREAIACARRYRGELDLLITAVILPERGGYELAREIEAIEPGIPALFMSAHPPAWLVHEGRLPEGVPSLRKPFTRDQLLAQVAEALGQSHNGLPAPADRRPRRAAATQLTAPVPGIWGAVLVVEDEPMARLAICEYLREMGWEVLEAPSGGTALGHSRAPGSHIAAVLTDYSLPDMAGDELARAILEMHPNAAVAYMSGFSTLELSPPGPLLVKPLDLAAVADTLGTLVHP